jgi:hypothetical protein
MPTEQEVQALAEAMDQLLDDMGQEGTRVCVAAKAQARMAWEPFRDKDDPAHRLMSIDEAKRILLFIEAD